MFGEKAAIRKYLDKLPSELQKRYGKPVPYSVGQVEKTIHDLSLNKRHIEYAYLIFCERQVLSDFDIDDEKYDKMLSRTKIAAEPSVVGAITGAYTGGSEFDGSASAGYGEGSGGGDGS